jgi:hypothetical protein
MTQTMNGRRSAYPAAVEQLLPEARAIAEQSGELPSLRALTRQLHVGQPKAAEIRAALAAERNAPETRPDAPAEVQSHPRPDAPDSSPEVPCQAAALSQPAVRADAPPEAHSEAPVTVSAGRVWSARLGTTAVALIAAVASYAHMRGLALTYGQEPLIATLLPLSVDGLVIVSAVAIGDGRRHTWSAWLSFWTGVGASIVANVLAAQPNLTARAISAWPAVALLLVVEVISRGGRRHR